MAAGTRVDSASSPNNKELYIPLDEDYISTEEFKDAYEQGRWARAAVRGFINYLRKYEEHKP